MLATAVPSPTGLAETTALYKDAFLSGSGNLVNLILHKGFLDLNSRTCVDQHDSALQLLSKVAQTFPETLTHLWSEQLSECLR